MDSDPPMTPAQLAASRSRRRCRCGHMEMYHVVPSAVGDEDRECWPPEEWDWDLATGEEVLVDGGCCACLHFVAKDEAGMEAA